MGIRFRLVGLSVGIHEASSLRRRLRAVDRSGLGPDLLLGSVWVQISVFWVNWGVFLLLYRLRCAEHQRRGVSLIWDPHWSSEQSFSQRLKPARNHGAASLSVTIGASVPHRTALIYVCWFCPACKSHVHAENRSRSGSVWRQNPSGVAASSISNFFSLLKIAKVLENRRINRNSPGCRLGEPPR